MKDKGQTDYYSVLGLSPEAKDLEVRKAYRKLALRYHPDRNSGNQDSEEKFKELNEAYRVLSDPRKRRAYDFWQMSLRGSSQRDRPWTEVYWSPDNDPLVIFSDTFGRRPYRRGCRGGGKRCGRRKFTSYDED